MRDHARALLPRAGPSGSGPSSQPDDAQPLEPPPPQPLEPLEATNVLQEGDDVTDADLLPLLPDALVAEAVAGYTALAVAHIAVVGHAHGPQHQQHVAHVHA